MYKPLQIEASQTLNVKSPLQGVGAGGLVLGSLEIAFKYKVKQRKMVNFLSSMRLVQSIWKREFPSLHKPLRI